MWKPRWWLAFPLALTALLSLGTSQAGTVHDNAGMFSREAVAKANAELGKIEREFKLDVTIETVPSLDGGKIADVTRRHAERSGATGIYILLAKKEKRFWSEVSQAYQRSLSDSEPAIRKAFADDFHKNEFDAGLLKGVSVIESEAKSAQAEHGSLKQAGAPARRQNAGPFRGGPVRQGRGGFGLGTLIWLGLLVFGGMFVFRMIAGLFGAGRGQHGYGPQGRMGGPGFGGPGYGGGGGGFMSGLLGGLGGAVAGNWLYDQFSGRHQGGSYSDTSGYDANAGNDAGAPDGWGGDPGGRWRLGWRRRRRWWRWRLGRRWWWWRLGWRRRRWRLVSKV